MANVNELVSLARAHHQSQNLPVAEAIYRQILAADPNQAIVWHQLGVLVGKRGDHALAVTYIERALTLDPSMRAARLDLGTFLQLMGNKESAIDCYRQVLILNPADLLARFNLGFLTQAQRKFEEAAEWYRSVIALNPTLADAHNNLGLCLQELGQHRDAIHCFTRAIEAQPDVADYHNNLGTALQGTSQPQEAEKSFRRAIELQHEFATAHNNLGTAVQDQGRYDEAEACYRQAVTLDPGYADAHRNHSLLALLAGDFENGWPEYEWRWKPHEIQPPGFPPTWRGEDLAGRTILIRCEQGLGDTIQFVRYLNLVNERGGRVIFECQRPLQKLLANLPVDALVAKGDRLPSFDTHALLVSLPRIFQTTLDTIPAKTPYLFAAPQLVEQWRSKLNSIKGFRIGIGWQGTENYPAGRRSIRLEEFAVLAEIPDVQLISLQKGKGSEQLQAAKHQFPVVEFTNELDEASGPFMDTAAIMKNVDLVITSDTSIAHLAGALSVPVWIAVPFSPDWRWLLDRDDSPWYPTSKLFRQRASNDWRDVFEAIQRALRQELNLPQV